MRLCYITYKVDAHDALVGHVVGWIKELARHLDKIEVVCLAAAPTEFPANVRVHSLGKESGVSRIGRWQKFFQVVWNLRAEIDSVFCQFSPEYVIGIAPLAFLGRWPITFWYTHRHIGFRLRLATALARRESLHSCKASRLAERECDSQTLTTLFHGLVEAL